MTWSLTFTSSLKLGSLDTCLCCFQVEPAVLRLLMCERPKYLPAVLGLLEAFPVSHLPLPSAITAHLNLLIPPPAMPTGAEIP